MTVVDADPQKVEHGRREGSTVVGHGTEQASFTLFENWLLPTDALILLCTKTYNNAAVLAVLPETSRLVPVQNGFDPKLDQRNHAAEGIASFVSNVCAIGPSHASPAPATSTWVRGVVCLPLRK